MDNIGKSSISGLEIISILSVLFASVVSLNEELNTVALYILLPIAFVCCFLMSKNVFINKYQKRLVILYIWIAFTALFAHNSSLATRQLSQLLGCFLLSYIYAVLSLNKASLKWAYVSFLLMLVSIWIYSFNNMSQLMSFDTRLGDGQVNSNYFAYHTLYTTFSIYVLGDIINNLRFKKFFRIMLFIMIPISFVTAFLTASRQILIIQVPLLACLFYLRYIYSTNTSKKFGAILLMSIIIVIGASKFLEFYSGSLLAARSETRFEDDIRSELIKEAVSVGLQNPVVGVGPGNFVLFNRMRLFSHCSYTELFANNGLLALILYIILISSFIINQWKNFRRYRDKMNFAFLLFGCLFFVEQVFYVFYISQSLISFFILVASHSLTYNRDKESIS